MSQVQVRFYGHFDTIRFSYFYIVNQPIHILGRGPLPDAPLLNMWLFYSVQKRFLLTNGYRLLRLQLPGKCFGFIQLSHIWLVSPPVMTGTSGEGTVMTEHPPTVENLMLAQLPLRISSGPSVSWFDISPSIPAISFSYREAVRTLRLPFQRSLNHNCH